MCNPQNPVHVLLRVLVLNHLLSCRPVLAVAGFLFFEERGKFLRKLRRLRYRLLRPCVKCPLRRLMLFQFLSVGGTVRCLVLCFPIRPVSIDCLRIVYDVLLSITVLRYSLLQFPDLPGNRVKPSGALFRPRRQFPIVRDAFFREEI